MGICEENQVQKRSLILSFAHYIKMILGSGTCSGHMSERKHHKEEKQLILDSYTNEREDGQCIERKRVSAASEG